MFYNFIKGLKANLPSTGLTVGAYYQCTDTGELFLAVSETNMIPVAEMLVVENPATSGSVELIPKTMTVLGALTGAVSFTLGAASGAGVQEYALRFTMGATAYGVTFPTSVKFPEGYDMTGYFEANKTYEVDIVDGRATAQKWAN